jgi:2-furoate---CoA ligase
VNLGRLLVAAAERHPDAEAVVDAEERLTYADVLERAQSVAGGLAALGVKPGERVVGALRNRVETVVLYWACQWLGACFVPVNWRLKPAEIRYCATDADATVFVAEPHLTDQVGARPHAELPADAAPGPSDVGDSDPALMLYTSGTTGRPKGVPRSQRAEWSAALAHVIQCRYQPGERTLGVMPLYHTMAVRSLLAMHAVGGCFVLRPEFNAAEAIEVIAAERISALYLAPTLYHDLVEALAAGARDGRLPVPRLAYAGAPMSATLVEHCRAAFAPEVFVNHYGSTEIYTFSIHSDQRAKPGCAGRPGVHGRLRLEPLTADPAGADEDGGNAVGEILAALDSDEAFTGYWNRPDADARALTPDGWYRTGDLGRLDADGDLWVVGRADDMVISGGENIHPTEVEDTLVDHPAVIEAAVIGQADPRLGQRVTAFVVTREEIEPSVLDAWCRRSALADFKRPREYRFVEALPKSPSGKLLRRLLREDPPP